MQSLSPPASFEEADGDDHGSDNNAGTDQASATAAPKLEHHAWSFPSSDLTFPRVDPVSGRFGVLPGSSGVLHAVAEWVGARVGVHRLYSLLPAGAPLDEFVMAVDDLSQLRHPNLAQFVGIAYNEKTLQPEWMVTEHLPRTVTTHMAQQSAGALTTNKVVAIAVQVARVLSYLHQRGALHGALTSASVFVQAGAGRVKLAHVGHAALGHALGAPPVIERARAYWPATIEITSDPHAQSIDVFSFGVLLAELCTGEEPSLIKRRAQVCVDGLQHTSLAQ